MNVTPAQLPRPSPASAINQAAGLRGHLLVVHGSADDNVHFQGAQMEHLPPGPM